MYEWRHLKVLTTCIKLEFASRREDADDCDDFLLLTNDMQVPWQILMMVL
jgi:hypothetical protein